VAERRASKSKGFGETQAPFQARGVALDAIFRSYGFVCAFTGEDLRAEAHADPFGTLLRLTEPTNPQSFVPGNFIPACLDAIYAYERGHLALGVRHNFLIDLSTIVPELLERLNANGKLILPPDKAFYPSSAALKAHRDAFAEGAFKEER
jgi:hypothetical protein